MKTKIFIVLTLVCLVCLGIMLCIGTIGKNVLSEQGSYEKIESVEGAKGFIEDCNKKLFLNCEQLLLRRIEG